MTSPRVGAESLIESAQIRIRIRADSNYRAGTEFPAARIRITGPSRPPSKPARMACTGIPAGEDAEPRTRSRSSSTGRPATRPSKRRPPRWSVIARELAEAFGLKPADVRERLTAALEAERGR